MVGRNTLDVAIEVRILEGEFLFVNNKDDLQLNFIIKRRSDYDKNIYWNECRLITSRAFKYY